MSLPLEYLAPLYFSTVKARLQLHTPSRKIQALSDIRPTLFPNSSFLFEPRMTAHHCCKF